MTAFRPFVLTLALTLFLPLLHPVQASASNALVLAAGAGYKKMVNALADAYSKKTGRELNLIYGNMGRVTTLAKESGKVDIVLGDADYLLGRAALSVSAKTELGRGKLVLAFARGSRFAKESDLDAAEAERIALPDVSKAIYGKAAREYLQCTGRLPAIQPRLVEVATVLQVFAYLTANEVDMGFMNLTHALNVADKVGGYVVLDERRYAPISIIAGLLADAPDIEGGLAFLDFIRTEEAQAIVRANGL